jgi:hypothetical protein
MVPTVLEYQERLPQGSVRYPAWATDDREIPLNHQAYSARVLLDIFQTSFIGLDPPTTRLPAGSPRSLQSCRE